VEAQARAVADTRERLVYLEREIEIQRSAGAEALERLSERERQIGLQVLKEMRARLVSIHKDANLRLDAFSAAPRMFGEATKSTLDTRMELFL
jgi:hypothetical protein